MRLTLHRLAYILPKQVHREYRISIAYYYIQTIFTRHASNRSGMWSRAPNLSVYNATPRDQIRLRLAPNKTVTWDSIFTVYMFRLVGHVYTVQCSLEHPADFAKPMLCAPLREISWIFRMSVRKHGIGSTNHIVQEHFSSNQNARTQHCKGFTILRNPLCTLSHMAMRKRYGNDFTV
jgi:hypothetical protein